MAQDEWTLDDLSEKSGLPSRIIRSYIEQGLLRGPSSKGRYARYSDYHLTRLLAIRALRDQGLTLADIRIQLMSMSDEAVSQTAALVSPAAVAGAAPSGSALDYLRQLAWRSPGLDQDRSEAREPLRNRALPRGARPAKPTPPLARAPEASNPFETLLVALQQSLATRRVDRQSRGEAWFRIPVTPEIELHVRGAFSPEALATLERMADYLREIALGGVGPPAPP